MHKSKQLEVLWDEAEPFALAIKHTMDGDRVAREASQLVADKQESEKQQLEITA